MVNLDRQKLKKLGKLWNCRFSFWECGFFGLLIVVILLKSLKFCWSDIRCMESPIHQLGLRLGANPVHGLGRSICCNSEWNCRWNLFCNCMFTLINIYQCHNYSRLNVTFSFTLTISKINGLNYRKKDIQDAMEKSRY
jgi:hypothetical protein